MENEYSKRMIFRDFIEENEEIVRREWSLSDLGADISKPFYCYGCNEMVSRMAYTCQETGIQLHKSCAELPLQITHPLHPQHPLTFLYDFVDYDRIFICDGCNDANRCAAAFYCKLCNFYLDFKCALLMDDYFSKHDRQEYEERKKKANVDHFSHTLHSLKLGNSIGKYANISCFFCRQGISGSAYCCFDCNLFIHESCKDEMPEEVEHPFLPGHRLRIYGNNIDYFQEICAACRGDVRGIRLGNNEQGFFIHYSCARKPFPRPLKLKSHDHSLYYFGYDAALSKFQCEICRSKRKGPAYRCVECIYSKEGCFHLECISLPRIAKHRSHKCDLTLCDSVKGYHSHEYCCDICEEKGNSRHHVYTCEKCNYIAHIECVIAEDGIPYWESKSEDKTKETDDTDEKDDIAYRESGSEDKTKKADDTDNIKEGNSQEIQSSSSVAQLKSDAEQEIEDDEQCFCEEDEEEIVPYELNVEIDSFVDELGDIALILQRVKGKRANRLRSMLLSCREKIMVE